MRDSRRASAAMSIGGRPVDYHQQHLAKNPDGYCGIDGYGVPFKVVELQGSV